MSAVDSYEVYFEAQDEETSLCGQHALNNLLQGAYFTAIDLGAIGAKLDEQEQNLLSIDEDEKLSEEVPSSDIFDPNGNGNNGQSSQQAQTRERKYSNVSMEGLFSVDVLITALASIKLDALPLSHPQCQSANVWCSYSLSLFTYYLSIML